MQAREAFDNGLEIFTEEMRDLVREKLQAEYGEDWCSKRVAPLFDGRKGRDIRTRLKKGAAPETLIDALHFQQVIAAYGDLFPEPIRKDSHHHERLREIAKWRNKHAHYLWRRRLRRAEAEEFLSACSDVLRQCNLVGGATEIEDLARAFQESSPSETVEQGRSGTKLDADSAMYRGLDIYRTEIRHLVRTKLQAEYGPNWFIDKVVPVLSPHKPRRITSGLNRGVSPELLLDVNQFPRVLAEYGWLFPEITDITELHTRLRLISNKRNSLVHSLHPAQATAEECLHACSDVLRELGLAHGASEIDNLLSALQE